MANLLKSCIRLPPQERALVLEGSEELEHMYKIAAEQGDSRVPDNAEDEVDFHYVCFVKSHKSGRLYELVSDGSEVGRVK
jgi:ubiquitin carboxyl-terminal hydrolase L3